MEIVDPFVKKIELDRDKKIEYAGRLCYKSENKITENSHEKFIAGLIKSGHESVIEHGVFSVMLHHNFDKERELLFCDLLKDCTYIVSDPVCTENGAYLLTGNMRAWRDMCSTIIDTYDTLDEIIGFCKKEFPLYFADFELKSSMWRHPLEIHLLSEEEVYGYRYEILDIYRHIFRTFHYRTDRAIAQQITRHRNLTSFSMESQRYCNYSKDKFGRSIKFIIPDGLTVFKETDPVIQVLKQSLSHDETTYFELINVFGIKAEDARGVLPNCTATEFIMTTNVSEWQHIFNERCTSFAQSDVRKLMEETRNILRKEFPDV